MMLIKDSSKMIYYLLSISLDNNLKIWNAMETQEQGQQYIKDKIQTIELQLTNFDNDLKELIKQHLLL